MKNHLHKILTLMPEDIVLVHLNGPAMVYLMPSSEYAHYIEGESFSAYGGESQESPARLSAPEEGNWHIVIETLNPSGDLTVRVEIKQVTRPSSSEREVKKSTEVLNHKEPVSEYVEIEEGRGGNTFVLQLNKRRHILTRLELRGLVKAARTGRLPSQGGQALFKHLSTERLDILQDGGIRSENSPILLDLAALIRSRYKPKEG